MFSGILSGEEYMNGKFYSHLDVLKPEFEINMDPKKEIEVVEEEPKKTTNTSGLQKLWKYKLSDLHEIAEKLGIEVKIGNKNKKKEDLYEEIKMSM